jgi:phospho-N-acetylmuramoyl-pentapeptide-transferase
LRETFPISVQVIAFISAFTLAVIIGIIIIPMLKRFKFGQTVRDDGPSTHLAKTGTPTMGGLIFLIPITLISVILSFNYHEIIVLVIATLGFGAVGFIDDFIKISKKRKDKYV